MYFKFKTCMGSIYDATLCSSKNEDSDHLHRVSQELRVENPAIQFFKMDRIGGFKDLNPNDYRRLTAMIQKISFDYFRQEDGYGQAYDINIFLLADRLFRDYIRNLEMHQPDYFNSDDEDY